MPGVVGREQELAAAESFLSDGRGGARALVVEGEAGIGKTAVWRAILDRARALGYQVLTTQAAQTETSLPFVGLGDLLGPSADSVLPTLPGPQRRALAAALAHDVPADGRPPDPRTLAVAVTSALSHLARERPLVVAVDDVHWLDVPTGQALGFAARRLGESSVCLALTVRTPLTNADVLGLERSLEDRLTRQRLGPLSLGALRALLERRLGRGYARPTLVRILDASQGNPLFALEIARTLGSSPSVDPTLPLPVPESLREIVDERIRGLTPATRAALLAAAALARPSAAIVERVAPPAGLAAAEEAGLVRIADGRVLFAHPLYASAIYGASSTRRRRLLHRRLATLVVDPEERARHLAAAAPGPDAEAVAALEEAAIHARGRGAWEVAGGLLERARALTPADQPDEAGRRGVRAAQHHAHAGDRPRARALLEQILAEPLAPALRAEALALLGEISHNDENFPEAIVLLREALEFVEDPRLEIAIELNLAYVYSNEWDFHMVDVWSRRALERAEAFDDPALVAAALAFCAMAGWLCGRGVDWNQVERSLALEDPEQVVVLVLRPSLIAAFLTMYVERYAEAREKLTRIRDALVARGDESDLAFVLLWLSWLETRTGNLGAAARLAEEAAALGRMTGSKTNHAWSVAQRALVHAHGGDVDAARRDCAEATALLRGVGHGIAFTWIAAAVAVLELSLGNPRAAWDACEPFVEGMIEKHGLGEPLPAFFLPDAIEALVDLGQLRRAAALLDELEGRGRALDRVWALATGARCRGLLCAATGDLAGAAAALQRALVEHERLDMPIELARTLLVLGVVERRARQRGRAKEHFEQALAIFERADARLWTDRAREELGRTGLRAAPSELTATEARVAELTASGLTGKEVASQLFLSPKTVQANLARVYHKLGVSSRAELGARMASHAAVPQTVQT